MAIRSDSFEILRDFRALYLRQLGALLQGSGLLSGQAVAAIQQGAGNFFDEVINSKQRGSFAEEADGLTSSRLTLLGEDELELGIRLDNLTSYLLENTGGGLWKLHLRFVTLLERPNLPKSDNPAGPQSISHGLSTMFAAADASSLEQKLALLDRIEIHLRDNLPSLYADLNGLLERNGVEGAQPSIVGAPEGPSSQKASPASHENALLALQQALVAHLPAQPAGSAPVAAGASAQLLNQTSLEQLMFRLEALERVGGFSGSFKPGAKPATDALIPALFAEEDAAPSPQIIRSEALGIPKTSPESLSIDTLAMIFEAIFADPELPDALKAAISSLQIKLLKVAMQDQTLFTDPQHPARLTIDRMGQALLGLPLDVPARHPICVRLFELASQLRTQANTDKFSFDAALSALDTLIAERRASVLTGARAYQPLLARLEQRDAVAEQIKPVIDKLLDSHPPEVVRHFIEQRWSKILLQVGLESGVDSPSWQEHASTIEGLLWSFQPKIAGEERKALAQRLPTILKSLKESMARIGMPVAEQEAFLDDCFTLQTQALRPLTTGAPTPPDSAATERVQQLVSDEVSEGAQVLSTLDFSNARTSSQMTDLNPGSWLAFKKADGETAVGCVCQTSANRRHTLLVNPDCGLALAMDPAILEQQLREGEATLISTRSLFDRAATQALRQSKPN